MTAYEVGVIFVIGCDAPASHLLDITIVPRSRMTHFPVRVAFHSAFVTVFYRFQNGVDRAMKSECNSALSSDKISPLVGTPVPAVTRTGPSPGT